MRELTCGRIFNKLLFCAAAVEYMILTRGVLYPTPEPIMVKFDTLKHTHNVHLHAKFRPDQFILSPVKGDKPQVLPHSQIRHPMLAPPSGVGTTLNVGTQLQTFPYPMMSKPLLRSNAFWAKSFSQTLSLKSAKDRQTDKKLNALYLCR